MLLSKLVVATFFAASISSTLLPKRIEDVGPTNLDGDWRVVRFQSRGNVVDPTAMAHVVFRINGSNCLYMSNGAVVNEFKWTRDETLRPYTLDIEYIGDNPNTKQQYAGGVKAIYRLVDGKLERNYAEPGKPRPTDFKSTPENGHTLILLEKMK